MNNYCELYGIDPEFAGRFDNPPIINEKIALKISVIDRIALIKRSLDTIENSFRNAPLDEDEEHLGIMDAVSRYVEGVDNNVTRILESYIH